MRRPWAGTVLTAIVLIAAILSMVFWAAGQSSKGELVSGLGWSVYGNEDAWTWDGQQLECTVRGTEAGIFEAVGTTQLTLTNTLDAPGELRFTYTFLAGGGSMEILLPQGQLELAEQDVWDRQVAAELPVGGSVVIKVTSAVGPSNASTLRIAQVSLAEKEPERLCTVTWKYNDGTTEDRVEQVEYGAYIVEPEAPIWTGYRFLGWEGYDPLLQVREDLTFMAVWEPVMHTVRWVDRNGVEVAAKEIHVLKTFEELEHPALPEPETVDDRFVCRATHWAETEEPALIRAVYAVSQAAPQVRVAYPPTPAGMGVVEGDRLSRMEWSADPEAGAWKLFSETGTALPPGIYYVRYVSTIGNREGLPETGPGPAAEVEIAKRQYTVTFLSDGKAVKSQTLDYGALITAPAAPAREGYAFRYWSGYVPGMTVRGEETFRAVWAVKEYSVTWVFGNGAEDQVFQAAHGATPALPADPVKSADSRYTYRFTGWSPAVGPVTGPVTYEAVYTAVRKTS